MTFRALQNKLTDFDRSVMKITAVSDRFFPQAHKLELATVACLPNSHQRALKRIAEQDRLNQTAGYIGAVGDKVTVTWTLFVVCSVKSGTPTTQLLSPATMKQCSFPSVNR
jgi:hypothetical protein